MPNFTQALGQVNKDSVTTGYINIEALVANIDKAVQQVGPPEDAADVAQDSNCFGHPRRKRMIFTQGFSGKEWETREFLSAPEPREGLVAMLANGKPLSNEIYSHHSANRSHGRGRPI